MENMLEKGPPSFMQDCRIRNQVLLVPAATMGCGHEYLDALVFSVVVTLSFVHQGLCDR